MNKNKVLISLIISLFFLGSFTLDSIFVRISQNQDPYFTITEKDVELVLPKGFPKPNYNFKKNKITPNGFVLGRQLFYDPILSLDSTISCGSCHQQYAAFAHIDHSLSHGVGSRIGLRNVSALQNLIWNERFMWDGGINHIEIQAIAPITNQVEMAETLENVINKLNKQKHYRIAFFNAFGDSTITSEKMLKSLTQFMGLMISSNSRYDKYIEGKETFSNQEKNGLKLFKSNCATCHTEPLFTNNSFTSNGIKPNPRLNDKGKAQITGIESDNYKFKVPSLRNISLTYPYMHDGRHKSLIDVLNFYNDSSQHSNYTDPLVNNIQKLSKDDINDIISFLNTLTDKSFIYDRRFADPNHKKIR